ncbi:MAG: Shikimate dehydrogenase [Gemmatimonadetes bacterium]|nr:Shikimate dehydrogenase [Gemmatimonadota bacterium]
MRQPGRLVLLGHPVGHSLSPRIHNAALSDAGIPLRYEALDVEPRRFDETLEMLRAERAAGNVTVPHKERMFAACDVLTPLARRVGAVNVFWTDDDGRLVGDNTDVGGFDAAVTQFLGQRPTDLSVGVLGAGGAAAAVLAAVEGWAGCVAHVYNRTPERARLLCERFSAVAHPVDDVGVIAGAQLVVNATSIGLKDDGVPVDPFLIPRDAAVIDLVYRPGETNFVRALRGRGNRATDGIGMLVEQAALAFETWFGIAPSRELMHEALLAS